MSNVLSEVDIQGFSDGEVKIEIRRPSGAVTRSSENLRELEDRQGEIWSERIDQWHGRVAQVFKKG